MRCPPIPCRLGVLDALNQGQTNLAVPTCEPACADTFYKV